MSLENNILTAPKTEIWHRWKEQNAFAVLQRPDPTNVHSLTCPAASELAPVYLSLQSQKGSVLVAFVVHSQ